MEASFIIFDRGFRTCAFNRDYSMCEYIVFAFIWHWKKTQRGIKFTVSDESQGSVRLHFSFHKDLHWSRWTLQSPFVKQGL